MKNPSFRFVLAPCSLASAWLSAADGPQFRSRPLQAGRASLASGGFTLQRTFGTANFTPELAWPVLISCTATCHADGQLATATRTGGPRSAAAATSNPDGWNQMAYCGNGVTGSFDWQGALTWDSSSDGWGHASMQLTDGTYISWWPSDEGREGKQGEGGPTSNIYDAPHITNWTYADDKAGEDGRTPWSRDIVGLNETAIKDWWIPFNADTNNLWSTLSQNCSTVVAKALKIGGAEVPWWDGWNFIWIPEDVQRFATAISE